MNDHALWRNTGHDGWESTGYFERCILPSDHNGPCEGEFGSRWQFEGQWDRVLELGRR